MKTKKSWFLAVAILPFAFIALAVEQVDQASILPVLETPDFSQLIALPVVRIVDGDTIIVKGIDKDIRVRLIGVDTPETVHPAKPVEYYGKEASRFTDNLLKGEKVYLVSDTDGDKIDKYGRTLAHVYRAPDGLFVNAEIIHQGYGHAYTRFPFKYMEEFKQLERFARKAEKGLWGPTATLPIATPKIEKQLDTKSVMVYVTRTGKKYHRGSCSYLRKSKIPMTPCHKGQFQLDFPPLFVHESRILPTTPFTPLIERNRSGLLRLRRILCPLLTSAWRSGNLAIASVPNPGHHTDLPT